MNIIFKHGGDTNDTSIKRENNIQILSSNNIYALKINVHLSST